MTDAAVLLLAHGTPETLEDIPAYLRNITGGRPMPEAVVEEVRRRYELIGGSPLTRLTLEQARLLAAHTGVPVYAGMRNWKPTISEVVTEMRAAGVRSVVAICLAPQNSRTSVGLYRRALEKESAGLAVEFVEGWAEHPLLAEAFAERLQPVWERLCEETGASVPVLFTAHSVPLSTVQKTEAGTPDPYEAEARQTAALVAARVAGLREWRFAFQSQGLSGGPWLGPTVEEALTELRQAGHTAVVLSAIGFLCDHVEILYDIDIAFRAHAEKLGMRLVRPPSLNDSPLLTAALADVAREGFRRLEQTRDAVSRSHNV